MPYCDIEECFTIDEREIIKPVLDHNNKLHVYKPPFISKDSEAFYILAIDKLYRKKPFTVPYQSLLNKYYNPFLGLTEEEVKNQLSNNLSYIDDLVDDFIRLSITKVY